MKTITVNLKSEDVAGVEVKCRCGVMSVVGRCGRERHRLRKVINTKVLPGHVEARGLAIKATIKATVKLRDPPQQRLAGLARASLPTVRTSDFSCLLVTVHSSLLCYNYCAPLLTILTCLHFSSG